MDIRSKELNMENVLCILDAGFAAELEATFMKDLRRSKEIKLEEWRRRSWLHRALERVCSLFVPTSVSSSRRSSGTRTS